MSSTAIQIIERRSGELVEAILHEALSVERILRAEESWGPVRNAALQRLLAEGCSEERLPEHGHWNWSRKIGRLQSLTYRCLGVECAGQIQGMMMVALAGYAARLPPDLGKQLVYVDFIETAPWNVRPLAVEPQFQMVGFRLIEAAVRRSLAVGFDGRVGLHALSQAEPFYSGKCQMTTLGPDPDYNGLAYYELTREQAVQLLKGA